MYKIWSEFSILLNYIEVPYVDSEISSKDCMKVYSQIISNGLVPTWFSYSSIFCFLTADFMTLSGEFTLISVQVMHFQLPI